MLQGRNANKMNTILGELGKSQKFVTLDYVIGLNWRGNGRVIS